MLLTQRERIASGKLFTDMSEGLPEERLRAKERMYDFNHTRPTEIAKRQELMKEMFGAVGERCWIEPPISFCYGTNVFLGDMVYANFNLSLVDDYRIIIRHRPAPETAWPDPLQWKRSQHDHASYALKSTYQDTCMILKGKMKQEERFGWRSDARKAGNMWCK